MEKRIQIYCDGASNSFESAFCVCLKKSNGKPIYHLETFDKKHPVIKIEYLALISALKFAEGKCNIYTDCNNICRELDGKRKTMYLARLKEVRKLISSKDVKINWISREKNLAGIYLEKRLMEMRRISGLNKKFVYRKKRKR